MGEWVDFMLSSLGTYFLSREPILTKLTFGEVRQRATALIKEQITCYSA